MPAWFFRRWRKLASMRWKRPRASRPDEVSPSFPAADSISPCAEQGEVVWDDST